MPSGCCDHGVPWELRYEVWAGRRRAQCSWFPWSFCHSGARWSISGHLAPLRNKLHVFLINFDAWSVESLAGIRCAPLGAVWRAQNSPDAQPQLYTFPSLLPPFSFSQGVWKLYEKPVGMSYLHTFNVTINILHYINCIKIITRYGYIDKQASYKTYILLN